MKLKQPSRQLAQTCSIIFIVILAFWTGVTVGGQTPLEPAMLLEWILVTFLFGIGFLSERE